MQNRRSIQQELVASSLQKSPGAFVIIGTGSQGRPPHCASKRTHRGIGSPLDLVSAIHQE
jgi:hypothetical protein